MSARTGPFSRSGAGQTLRLAVAAVCGLILMAMMMMTVADVIGRYIFNAPLAGATELTELLLAALIFLGLPAVSMEDGHVRVDILLNRFPPALEPFRAVLVSLLSAGVLSLISWRLWIRAGEFSAYGGFTETLKIPVAPIAYFASLATAVGALVTLAYAVRPIAGHFGHRSAK